MIVAGPAVRAALGSARASDITAREAEVLALLAQHLTNVQIAQTLYISVRTVETHVSSLLRKLDQPDRRSLARQAELTSARVSVRGPGIPRPVTPLIGRARERSEVAAALGERRLVTLVGPIGVGKTRLATSVAADLAAERRDGAWFVDLARVSDQAVIIASIAHAVGVAEPRSVSDESTVIATLADYDGLLVLDNCEHLLDGVRECTERILAACPRITVLATSRSRVLVPYEWVYEVSGLSVTDIDGDAVDLFMARVAAATADSTLPDRRRVARLCRALDGIALAIELAAARYSTFGLDGLEAALDEPLKILTAGTGSADRHRSLRGAISHSYELLDHDDRTLLRDVSVMPSWFDVEAARTVAAPCASRASVADRLARLAGASLLVVERGEPTRYRVLETIRQFGAEQLAVADEPEAVRALHERWRRTQVAERSVAAPCADDEQGCDRRRARRSAHSARQAGVRRRHTDPVMTTAGT